MRSLFLACLILFVQQTFASQGYYRFPALHNNTLVFTAEGDLWKMALSDKYAQRLTSQVAEESQASISPDGNWIAFVANYTGAPEVHVMPINGGLAKQLSFENTRIKLHGWSQNGQVLYSYNGRVGPAGNWTLKLVEPKSLTTTTLPLADAVDGSLAPDNTLFFSQFGLQVSTDNAKHYQGGAKGEIWKFSLNDDKEAEHLTAKHQGSVRSPMVAGQRVYFISNQSGSDNIWSMKLNGRDQQQHTRYTDWEVRSARLFKDKIAYQLGADIKILDLTTGQSNKVEIALTSDFAQQRKHWVNNPINYLTSAKQASDSKKVVITARGRVAIATADGSRLVEVATPANSRTRKAILSHDNQFVYAINDNSGELEIWQYPADGSEGAEQLTFDGQVFRFNLFLSPDGKFIAHNDKQGNLWMLDIQSKQNKKVLGDLEIGADFGELVWSSNSQLIALNYFQNSTELKRSKILLIDIQNNNKKVLTSDKYFSYSPAFSADNQWLYFLSDRNFDVHPNSPWGDRNMGANFDRKAQIFAIALNKDASFPFASPTELDQLAAEKGDKQENSAEPETNKKATPNKEPATIVVDWQGLEKRLWQVPVPAGNYSNLLANQKYLYVLDKITEPGSQPALKSIEIKANTKVETFAEKVQNASLSDDGKTLFMQQTGNKKAMFLVDAKAKFNSKAADIKINTSDWKLFIDPQQEWQQIFHDAWLMHRDSLFDKNMRGLDWAAVKQKYQPLLSRLTDRHELNDIFKQMMGELNTLHSQVYGGDLPTDNKQAKPATLGAQYKQNQQGVEIEKIYANDPELISMQSPLAKPGVNAQVGDVIHAINGQPIKVLADIAKALQNQVGKQVLLTLKRQGEEIKTVVKPGSTRDDYYQRYYDWVYHNQQKVFKTDEQIGYLHLRAMGAGDVENFAREFYAQNNKQGLIIDVRRNNGGNIDSWIIEKLLKRAWSFWKARSGPAYSNMQQAFRGHLVVLADQFTYSDGETFTAGVKALKLGTVIGKQTAGAGVWLSGRNRQADNGLARVAEFPVYAMDGRWITEGRGISPDIEVTNLPHATFKGEDAQLQQAIKFLQKKIKKQPVKAMKVKDFPAVEHAADDILK
ncbi:S41 family peptidase [Paraglaciecola aestuariivivens]